MTEEIRDDAQATSPADETTELDETTYALVLNYERARRAEAAWHDERIKVRDQLDKSLGSATRGEHAGKRVVMISRIRPRRFDTSEFAGDHPGLYASYVREASKPEIRVTVARDLPELGPE